MTAPSARDPAPPSAALIDDLAAEIERAMGGELPPGLGELVAKIRLEAETMFPAGAPSRPPKELAALGKDLGKELDDLEDILEAFLLFGSPPLAGS